MNSNIITTDKNNRIQLPETPHIADRPWTFDTSANETAMLLFLAKEPHFGMEYRIWLTDDEIQPWANLSCETLDRKYTDADNVRDTADAATEELGAWLRDCADAYSWTCTLAAKGQLDELIAQQVIPAHEKTDTDWLRPYETLLNAAANELKPKLSRHGLTLEMTVGENGVSWALLKGNDVTLDCDNLTSIRAWLRALDAISRH